MSLLSCRRALALLCSCVLLVSVAGQAGKGTKWRCRNRKMGCAQWAKENQCTANYGFMAEGARTPHAGPPTSPPLHNRTLTCSHLGPTAVAECAAACDLCENAGLAPTPAPFELDYVCNGKLASLPKHVSEPSQTPEGCNFHCRDNMTDLCARMAAPPFDGCTAHAAVMRKQCPETCGVCKALSMRVATAADYAKPACADTDEHKDACAGWASSGECVKNFGFMSASCGKSCGLCGDAPAAPEAASVASPAPATTATATDGVARKKCKKGKAGAKCRKAAKKAAAAAAAATGGAEATPAEEEAAPAEEDEEETVASGGGGAIPSGGGGSIPSEPTQATPAASASEAAPSEAKQEKAKGGGFMSGVKKAMGKVGDAIKGKKGEKDKEAPKAEL